MECFSHSNNLITMPEFTADPFGCFSELKQNGKFVLFIYSTWHNVLQAALPGLKVFHRFSPVDDSLCFDFAPHVSLS